MSQLHVERVGGLGGFGGVGSRVKSHGDLDTGDLSADDKRAVDALFKDKRKAAAGAADGFRYRITRTTAKGSQTVEVPESAVPPALAQCVKDELV